MKTEVIVVGILVCVLPVAFAQDPIADGGDESDASLNHTLLYTVPASIVNTVPGFGLGSLAQDDTRGFKNALMYDLVAWSLLGFGIATLNTDEEGPLAGPAVVSLLAGYAGYGFSRGYGLIRPFYFSFQEGIDRDNVFSPIFYNQIPGFGAGSYLQGDETGGTVGTVLDFTAFMLVGVLSGAALGGEIAISQAAGIGALASFTAGRVWGVYRPVRFRNEKSRSIGDY